MLGYAELFKRNEQQIALFDSSQDREALYMRRDGLTKVVTPNLDSRCYASFSTKPKNRVRRSRLIAKACSRTSCSRRPLSARQLDPSSSSSHFG